MGQYAGLDGKAAIVTGASRGIGRAIALELARQGARVVAVGRDEAALSEVAAAGKPLAGTLSTAAADLRTPEAPAAVVEDAARALGGFSILVNSAGATRRGDFHALTDEDMVDGFALKYFGTVRMCRAAWPHLAKGGGAIVNVAGVGAHTPEWEFTIGGPVNAALVNFTKAISKGSLAEGIRINLLCPGHIVTDRLHRRIRTLAERRGIGLDEAREEMRKAMKIDRYGEPEDIARVVAFLASDDAAYVHGATIDVDGGATPGI